MDEDDSDIAFSPFAPAKLDLQRLSPCHVKPLTPQLSAIAIPTMILNGELDFLTPRALHETLRLQIPDSALVIIPHAFHAFTLEKPALTADLLYRFAEDVRAGTWKGDRSVWIAPERAGDPLIPFPSGYDHLRAIPAHRIPA